MCGTDLLPTLPIYIGTQCPTFTFIFIRIAEEFDNKVLYFERDIMGGHNLGYLIICILVLVMYQIVNSQNEGTTLKIDKAQEKGAVCLDGSPGVYTFLDGFGDGVSSWVIYLPGGGWCSSTADCLNRATTQKSGSSNNKTNVYFVGIISPKPDINPDFYNWNKVSILYCDGGSFLADVEAVDPETNLHFRGRRIFRSVIEELMANKGMRNATNVILVGNSAGGLGTILNCDYLQSFLPNSTKLKCISDSGFFLHAENLPGADGRKAYYADVVALHGLVKSLPMSCTSRIEPGLCLFPENVVRDIKTPLFLLNADFDKYQISIKLSPYSGDELGWNYCTKDFNYIHNCTASQIQLIKDFRNVFLSTLDRVDDDIPPSRLGYFINSCYIHDFLPFEGNWRGRPSILNMTIAEAIGNWYLERSDVRLIDTHNEYPLDCSPSAIH